MRLAEEEARTKRIVRAKVITQCDLAHTYTGWAYRIWECCELRNTPYRTNRPLKAATRRPIRQLSY